MKQRILIISNSHGRWIQDDETVLSDTHYVEAHYVGGSFELSTYLKILKHDVIFFWFLSLKHFPLFVFSKFMGKKIITNIGGFEIENIPELNYGGFQPGWGRVVRESMMHNSDALITVSKYLSNLIYERTAIPNQVVHLGFKRTLEEIKKTQDRSIDFIMVSNVDDQTYLLKGVDYFFKMATMMPDHRFVLMGEYNIKTLAVVLPCNVEILGFISQKNPDFWKILNDSKFIVQPSRSEGFGSGVMEGAIQGAIPIVNNSGALPEIFKDIGFVWNFKNDHTFEVPKLKEETNFSISESLLKNYSQEKRALKLKNIITSITRS